MTTITRPPAPPVVQPGPTGDPRQFGIHIPEQVRDLVPVEVLDAVATVEARETAFFEALAAQAAADAVAAGAPEADAIALAAAIAAGDDDPGPANVTAAAAAKAEADRLAAGHERALHDARRALMDALSASDRGALVAAADARCSAMADEADAALARAAELVATAANVRRFASVVDVHPAVVSFDTYDPDTSGMANLLGRARAEVPTLMWPRPRHLAATEVAK